MSKKQQNMKWWLVDDVLALYTKCVSMEYNKVGIDTNYAVERVGDTLYIYFQGSSSVPDWINNFRFRAKPYNDMPDAWKCHRGFLACWNYVKDIIGKEIADEDIRDIVITGYSHGAALAVLCHEYCWFNRFDIAGNIRSYGFGCPRVVAHYKLPKDIRKRWKYFYVVRKDNDLVTHVPFKLLRFTHVNKPIVLGSRKDENMIKSHYPAPYKREIPIYTEKLKNDGIQ